MTTKSSKNTSLSKLNRLQKKGSYVCVGLDSDMELIPQSLRKMKAEKGIFTFNKRIIEATAPYACAFKPNAAFYEAEGIGGVKALEKTFAYLRKKHPEKLTILDAKRADIGNTNVGYAKMAFDTLGADALTVAPYIGGSMIEGGGPRLVSLAPFLARKDKLIFVLCRTSNEDAGEFQDLPVALTKLPKSYSGVFDDLTGLAHLLEKEQISGELVKNGYPRQTAPLYLVLAYRLANYWNVNGNLGLVVGATYPRELSWIRKIAPDMPILAPGFGFQGGDTELAVRNGLTADKHGLIVNSSRGIIFSGRARDDYDRSFARSAREAAKALDEQIRSYL